ncbi:MAG: hypothetical protein H7641_13425 [Candidatus Heimdallarchaeota archaeon]|nr:hypothetical protein [Candidatus Heimdallarchaeota archaeon]MCK4878561.1 hypothetical protein [Candidatus Heimdallarchaeota archaeon]
MTVKIPEFQFIHYEPIYTNPNEVYEEFSTILQQFKEVSEDDVNSKVLAYFYEGMLYLINADVYFKNKDYPQSIQNYEEANKLIVRSRASRGIEGDRIFDEMIKWVNYTEGMKRICGSFVEQDLDNQLSLLKESYSFLDEFYQIRKKEENFIDEKIALSRTNYSKYLFNKIYSNKYADNTKKYKRYLLKARTELMKANFFYQSLEEEFEELQNLIDEITKQHIVVRAEWFWDRGTENIALSQFTEALRFFAVASRYYARASEICENFMEQRLYLALSKITSASRFEAEANELYKRQDNPEQASKNFLKAVEIVDVALGFLATIKNEMLINNMTAQRSFYEGLALETEGIFFFDQENFKEALTKFESAMKKLNETQQSASEGGLEQLLEFVRLAKSEVDGYISMARTMI